VCRRARDDRGYLRIARPRQTNNENSLCITLRILSRPAVAQISHKPSTNLALDLAQTRQSHGAADARASTRAVTYATRRDTTRAGWLPSQGPAQPGSSLQRVPRLPASRAALCAPSPLSLICYSPSPARVAIDAIKGPGMLVLCPKRSHLLSTLCVPTPVSSLSRRSSSSAGFLSPRWHASPRARRACRLAPLPPDTAAPRPLRLRASRRAARSQRCQRGTP
jgi:hypothetical protein